MIRIDQVQLPEFGAEAECPQVPLAVHEARLAAAVQRMRQAKMDFLVVYADREHSANLAYLTGFDPRFEESVLLLGSDGRKRLVVGNECMGFLPDAGLGLEVELFQDFSLMGQPRGPSRPLREVLADFGIRPGRRVGCAGWKCYDERLIPGGPAAIDAPAYLADALRDLAGTKNVAGAVAIFADPVEGLRIHNEPEQVALYEYAAAITSHGVRRVVEELRVGASEQELAHLLDAGPLPLSCHSMIGFGAKARRGLASPSGNRARIGDAFTIGFGVTGSLTSRAGEIAEGPADLPAELRDFYPAYAANYFQVVAAWYAAIGVGRTAGAVFDAVQAQRDGKLYKFAVNPGHYIHLDEWVHSPFAAGSTVTLQSGVALQMDIIPVSAGPFCYINAEDGVVLADAALRQTIASRFPDMWGRMQARRQFMIGQLGLDLDESVLPLSNTPAWLPPYGLAPQNVFVQHAGR